MLAFPSNRESIIKNETYQVLTNEIKEHIENNLGEVYKKRLENRKISEVSQFINQVVNYDSMFFDLLSDSMNLYGDRPTTSLNIQFENNKTVQQLEEDSLTLRFGIRSITKTTCKSLYLKNVKTYNKTNKEFDTLKEKNNQKLLSILLMYLHSKTNNVYIFTNTKDFSDREIYFYLKNNNLDGNALILFLDEDIELVRNLIAEEYGFKKSIKIHDFREFSDVKVKVNESTEICALMEFREGRTERTHPSIYYSYEPFDNFFFNILDKKDVLVHFVPNVDYAKRDTDLLLKLNPHINRIINVKVTNNTLKSRDLKTLLQFQGTVLGLNRINGRSTELKENVMRKFEDSEALSNFVACYKMYRLKENCGRLPIDIVLKTYFPDIYNHEFCNLLNTNIKLFNHIYYSSINLPQRNQVNITPLVRQLNNLTIQMREIKNFLANAKGYSSFDKLSEDELLRLYTTLKDFITKGIE